MRKNLLSTLREIKLSSSQLFYVYDKEDLSNTNFRYTKFDVEELKSLMVSYLKDEINNQDELLEKLLNYIPTEVVINFIKDKGFTVEEVE